MSNELTIATISVYALILHQNQRNIKMSPVPAPIIKSRLNACPAFVSTNPNPPPRKIETNVNMRPTLTNFLAWQRGLQSDGKNHLQDN